MFYIVIGDVDVDETIDVLEEFLTKNVKTNKSGEVIRFLEDEPISVLKKDITKKLSINTPIICIGFKLRKTAGTTNIKNEIIVDFINDICFSSMSEFYEKLYKQNIITHEPTIFYDSGENFSHIVISAYAEDIEKFEKETVDYINNLKTKGIDKTIFEIVKAKKEGEYIYNLESTSYMYRNIIQSIIQKTDIYESQNILTNIFKEDIDSFLRESLDMSNVCISKVLPK